MTYWSSSGTQFDKENKEMVFGQNHLHNSSRYPSSHPLLHSSLFTSSLSPVHRETHNLLPMSVTHPLLSIIADFISESLNPNLSIHSNDFRRSTSRNQLRVVGSESMVAASKFHVASIVKNEAAQSLKGVGEPFKSRRVVRQDLCYVCV